MTRLNAIYMLSCIIINPCNKTYKLSFWTWHVHIIYSKDASIKKKFCSLPELYRFSHLPGGEQKLERNLCHSPYCMHTTQKSSSKTCANVGVWTDVLTFLRICEPLCTTVDWQKGFQNCPVKPRSWALEQWSGRTSSQLQMNRLSLRNNRLKFKTAGKLPIILEESVEYTPI